MMCIKCRFAPPPSADGGRSSSHVCRLIADAARFSTDIWFRLLISCPIYVLRTVNYMIWPFKPPFLSPVPRYLSETSVRTAARGGSRSGAQGHRGQVYQPAATVTSRCCAPPFSPRGYTMHPYAVQCHGIVGKYSQTHQLPLGLASCTVSRPEIRSRIPRTGRSGTSPDSPLIKNITWAKKIKYLQRQ